MQSAKEIQKEESLNLTTLRWEIKKAALHIKAEKG